MNSTRKKDAATPKNGTGTLFGSGMGLLLVSSALIGPYRFLSFEGSPIPDGPLRLLFGLVPIAELCFVLGTWILLRMRSSIRRTGAVDSAELYRYASMLAAGSREEGSRIRFPAAVGAIFLSLICGLLLGFSIGETAFRLVYRVPSDIFRSLGLLPGYIDMTTGASTSLVPAGRALVFLAALLLAALVGGVLLAILRRLLRPWMPIVDRKSGPLALALMIVGIAQLAFLPGESPTIGIVRSIAGLGANPEQEGSNRPELPAQSLVRAASDQDLFVIIVESYGQAAFRGAGGQVLRRNLEQAEADLTRAGWTLESGYVQAPVFGGRSWIADAALLAGREVRSQRDYDLLFAGERAYLPASLRAAGMSAVLSAPGTVWAEQPWLDFMGFDRYLFQGDFSYAGPDFGFGAVPDQLHLARLAREMQSLPSPRFLTAVLVSSHLPWQRVPAFVQDVERLEAADYFSAEGGGIQFRNNWLVGFEHEEGYRAATAYSLASAFWFLNHADVGRAQVLVLGDHQPPPPVGRRDDSFLVPLHLLTKGSVAPHKAFPDLRLSPGLVPEAVDSAPGSWTLAEGLIRWVGMEAEHEEPVLEDTLSQELLERRATD